MFALYYLTLIICRSQQYLIDFRLTKTSGFKEAHET